ncbi:cytochrome P450 [Streptomyces sp. NBC_01335]|uniref:cytochrome P450 n=1 Tax=Streptomyces sp. NBC_01335 TaxID=2903828 RepID=UPI002E0F4F13|nr:cytochrome P450 [Streptomyces sp. NBC_01335]
MTETDARTETGGEPRETLRSFPLKVPEGLGPIPELAELRRREPVVRVRVPSGGTAWLVTRHADVRKVLADPRFSRRRASRGPAGPGGGAPRRTALPDSILAADPPEHSRLRKLVAPSLTARRTEAMRADIARLADSLLTDVAEQGPGADLVPHFTRPLPLTVICDLLGTPRVDAERLDAWDNILRSVTARNAEVSAVVAEMSDYLARLLAVKRAHPGNDMLSVLIAARDDEDRLSEGELISFCIVLLAGGYGTTADRLAGLVHLLLQNPPGTAGRAGAEPERYALLRRDPGLVPGAVEELLRYAQASVGSNMRVATEPVRLGDVTVAEGETVIALMSSANHDETVYEEPELLDLTRAAPAHLAFGHGAHFCVGAQLARIQLQEALTALTRRFPTLHAAAPPAWKGDRITRAPRTLPVAW